MGILHNCIYDRTDDTYLDPWAVSDLSGAGDELQENITECEYHRDYYRTVFVPYEIRLPVIVNECISGFGDMIGPASMMVVGMIIGNVDLKWVFCQKRPYFICFLRLIFFPMIIILIFACSGIRSLHPDAEYILMIVILAASAPAAVMVTQLAQIHDRDAVYASVINVMSVIFCIVTMPLMLLFYERLSKGKKNKNNHTKDGKNYGNHRGLQLLGGLALFLYGMQMMSTGLETAAGNKMKTILEKLTSNRIKGVIAGAIITAVIQSSSATTVMVVGFVNSGLMTLRQAVWVIMGANIGTTITGQLIALDVGAMAPFFCICRRGVHHVCEKRKSKTYQ